jgi:EmrB/QacA subfamily drug resistance transporter
MTEVKDNTMFQSSLPRRQVIITLVGTMFAMFLGALYMTVVATAMPRIITDLGGFSQYSWVFTSFMIAQAITIPIFGKLSDMYGRKWFFVIGIVVFVLASFLSGMSQTMTQLIIFRALQGIGVGITQSLSFIVIADIFPPEERGKYIGLMSAVFGLSTIIGPTIGGYLTDYLSWRWCFFINIPLGVIVVFLFIFLFPQLRVGAVKHKVDYAGTVALALAVIPLMLALTWGGVNYGWFSPIILGMFGLSILIFAFFFVIESHAEEPLVPLGLFRNGVIAVSSAASFLTGFAFFTAIPFIPLYFQGVLGASASMSGSFLTPMMLTSAVASTISGQALSRAGGHYRLQGFIGFMMMAVGFFLLSRMTVETSYATAIINTALVGFGSGIIMPIYTLTVQNTVSYSVMGIATAMVTWLRTIGALFGMSIVGSVLNNRFNSAFNSNLPDAVKAVVSPEKLASIVDNPQSLVNTEAQAQLLSLFEGLGAQGTVLFEQALSVLRNALNSAVTEVFIVLLAGSFLAVIINFFLKGIPKYTG